MRSSGRRLNIRVNEAALRAWLTGGKPANTVTPQTQSATPESRTGETATEKR